MGVIGRSLAFFSRRQLFNTLHHILSNGSQEKCLSIFALHHRNAAFKFSTHNFQASFSGTITNYSKHTGDIDSLMLENEDKKKSKQQRKKKGKDAFVQLYDEKGFLIGDLKYDQAVQRARNDNWKLEKMRGQDESQKSHLDAFQLTAKKKVKKTGKSVIVSPKIEDHDIKIRLKTIKTHLKKNFMINVTIDNGKTKEFDEESLTKAKRVAKTIQTEVADIASVTRAMTTNTYLQFSLKPLITDTEQHFELTNEKSDTSAESDKDD